MNYFQELNQIDVSDKTEKKGQLTYLSWAWAWEQLKLKYPEATSTVYENADGLIYHTDGRTAWVKTGVTVPVVSEDGRTTTYIEHIEYLPVMDFKNNSIPLEKITSTDVNKAIQRSLTKAIARHGLGLYIYAGEDIPKEEEPKMRESAFPSRVKMLGCAMKHYPEGSDQLKSLLEMWKVKSIEDATNAQLMAIWSKYGDSSKD